MPQFVFGTGTVAGKRTDVANTPPVQFGVVKDVSVDFSKSLKELIGQYNIPVAIGAGELKVAGKIGFAKISFSEYNNLFFGGTGVTGMLQMTPAPGVAASVPGSSTYTVTPTVPSSGTWVEDMGVYYANTGAQLTPGSVATGSYTVSAGVYTFASGDASAALLFYFTYTQTSGNKVVLSNQLMGPAPTFEMTLQESFQQYGTTKVLNMQLNSCIASKLNFPFKNTDFMMNELDFMIQQDAAGNWGTFSVTDN